jgi:hypothetical protein
MKSDTCYFARRLALSMFLDLEAPDLSKDFISLYKGKTGREPSKEEIEEAIKVIKGRKTGFPDPPPSASGLAYKIPELITFDPEEE